MNLHMETVSTAPEAPACTTEGEAAVMLIALVKQQRVRRLDDSEYKQLLELEALLMSAQPLPSDSKITWSRNVLLSNSMI